jgi:alpha-galactosidase
MSKIAFIGAGSLEFTRQLIRDILTFPLLRESIISLMDIDAERLDFSKQAAEKIIRMGNYPARVEATLDRAEALKGADVVLITILVGSTDVWRSDIEIPKSYGIDTNIGDTRGPSGIFRFLRTIPVLLDIVHDLERYCPDAVLLNYTNPMAMLCGALQRRTSIPVTGLCHSVQGTAEMLAGWIGAPLDEISYTCAGLNHMAWYLKYEWNGRDAYPLIFKAVTERPEIYNEEIVRNEMYLNLGYYVTESSGHNSEYNWWFRKRSDLIEKYCTHGTGWNPGEYAYILKEYRENEKVWKRAARAWFAKETPISLERGKEYAGYIINALQGGDMYQFNGNVPNTQLVTNLPDGACVEVPVLVDKAGFHPIHVGVLPPQCAMLTNLTANIEELAIQGGLTGDPTAVYHAIAYDPLTASVLSLAEIKAMVNEMFQQNKSHLPQFKHFAA